MIVQSRVNGIRSDAVGENCWSDGNARRMKPVFMDATMLIVYADCSFKIQAGSLSIDLLVQVWSLLPSARMNYADLTRIYTAKSNK